MSTPAGALSLLNTPAYKLAAAQIGNTESYHAAEVRTLLYELINTTPAYNSTVLQITNAIVAAVNSLSGTPQLRYNLQNSQGSSIANVDSMGRTHFGLLGKNIHLAPCDPYMAFV